MKAKEYASKIIDAGYSMDAIKSVADDMIREIAEIAKARNVQTVRAIRAIILEQQQKWTAICRIVNQNGDILREDGFLELLKKAVPETEVILHMGDDECLARRR